MRDMPRRPDLTFEDALNAFLKAEGNTLLTGVSERNTCGRLAIYLERQAQNDGFHGYYADVEYNRKQGRKVKTIINEENEVIQITPDLIVHTRGERLPPDDNLIAIEVKKSSRPEREKQDDKNRLVAMTRNPFEEVWPLDNGHPEHVCGYAVGVYIEIDTAQRHLSLEFYKKGARTKRKQIPF